MPSAVLKLYELAHEPPEERRRKLPFASRRPRFIHMPLIRNPANRPGQPGFACTMADTATRLRCSRLYHRTIGRKEGETKGRV